MKIKCPVCDDEVKDFDSLKNHLWSSKTIEGDYIILAENYISLIKKIHEKIELLQKSKNDITLGNTVIEILKSLLEDVK